MCVLPGIFLSTDIDLYHPRDCFELFKTLRHTPVNRISLLAGKFVDLKKSYLNLKNPRVSIGCSTDIEAQETNLNI